jgi:hypothetical protein
MMLSNRLAKHFGAAAAAALVVGSANAAIVTWNLNLAIPNNIDGAYINIATQTTSTAGFTGYDLNPYSSATDALAFWAGTGAGYVRTQVSGAASSLPVGFVVDASNAYVGASSATAISGTTVFNGWQLNSINYFGFRFTHDTLKGTEAFNARHTSEAQVPWDLHWQAGLFQWANRYDVAVLDPDCVLVDPSALFPDYSEVTS